MTRIRFRNWNCIVRKHQYDNGRPALQLIDAEDGSPIAQATVNLPDVALGRNQVAIKDWSENEGMLDALVAAGVVKPTGETVRSGYVEVPICELQPPFREVSHAERVSESKGNGRSR
ncbi:DUF4313 domain-containing protein [Tautonia marina]|uniref:DUF4313 domain-containing protein n=1 Tax=Tautonia marina TaxID=2653855 RepID=UPI0012610B2E|nr:DUF4313 domain-containing protein [Tautonia marina]